MEYKKYKSREVVKDAHEIKIGDRVRRVRDDIWTCNGIWFTSNKTPECGVTNVL